MTKEQLEKELEILINRWRGKVPKENAVDWWKFRCDRCLAIRYRSQLEHYDDYLNEIKKIEPNVELTSEQMAELLT